PFVQSWRTSGQPDPSYGLYRYAAKIIGGGVGRGCALDGTPEGVALAREAGGFLIGGSMPGDLPLAFMPPPHLNHPTPERENDRWTMMMTPAEAGEAYLDLCDVTSDRKYLDAARRIAQTYRKRQLPTGTWHLKVDNQTGEPIAPNLLIPTSVIRFLHR